MYILEFKSFITFSNFCYLRIIYWNSAFFQLGFCEAAHPFDQRPHSGSQCAGNREKKILNIPELFFVVVVKSVKKEVVEIGVTGE